MVVGVRVVVRGRKRKGLEDRGAGRGLPCQENSTEKKAYFYSPFETAPPGPPPHSLVPIPLAGRGREQRQALLAPG